MLADLLESIEVFSISALRKLRLPFRTLVEGVAVLRIRKHVLPVQAQRELACGWAFCGRVAPCLAGFFAPAAFLAEVESGGAPLPVGHPSYAVEVEGARVRIREVSVPGGALGGGGGAGGVSRVVAGGRIGVEEEAVAAGLVVGHPVQAEVIPAAVVGVSHDAIVTVAVHL